MRKIWAAGAIAAAFVGWCAPALAQDYCTQVRAVSEAASGDFASLRGAQILSAGDFTTYAATASLPGGENCEVVVAHRANATVYTCSVAAVEGSAGARVRDFSNEIARCYSAAPVLSAAANEDFADAQLDAPGAQFVFSGDGAEVLVFVRRR